MTIHTTLAQGAIATMLAIAGSAQAQNLLQNPSFETLGSGAANSQWANWTDFGNTFQQTETVHTGALAAKSFGQFNGVPYNASGLFQEVATTPGQQLDAQIWVLNRGDDAIGGTNFAVMNIEWYNSTHTMLSYDSFPVADATTPVDTWTLRDHVFTAPATAVTARYVVLYLQPANDVGSIQWDDASLKVVAPACYANCDGSTSSPVLTAADFTCFLTKFRASDSYANCDGSTSSPVLTAADFTCFLTKFRAGCP
jgi:hypothetical protein